MQASLPTLALKCPAAHAAHVRSLDAVAALSMNSPAAHGARIGVHASPLSAAENVDPTVQGAHWRSAVAEPAVDMPWPTAHVFHATQPSLPALVLKLPAAHAAHSRFDETPGAFVSYLPAAHTRMALHVRSALPVGAADV